MEAGRIKTLGIAFQFLATEDSPERFNLRTYIIV